MKREAKFLPACICSGRGGIVTVALFSVDVLLLSIQR